MTNKVDKKNCILYIGGLDTIGNAGLQMDSKICNFYETYGTYIITCIVAQNFKKIYKIKNISASFVEQEFNAIINSELNIEIIKISIIGTLSNAKILTKLLVNNKIRIILDFVLVNKYNKVFMNHNYIRYIFDNMLPKCYLLICNEYEFRYLFENIFQKYYSLNIKNHDLNTKIDLLQKYLKINILVRNCKIENKWANILIYKRRKYYFTFEKYKYLQLHGLGCFFSSLLAYYLSNNRKLPKSCMEITNLISDSLVNKKNYNKLFKKSFDFQLKNN